MTFVSQLPHRRCSISREHLPHVALPSPVADMAKLAQETLGCQAELLCGGLGGPNRDRVLQHLITGHPLLIPHPGMTWEGVG